jgi:tetratricopeptide (TPR) repeat protein
VKALSRYMETVVKATELAVAKRDTAAIDAYRTAIPLNPRHPLAYLLLADVYLSKGNLGEAEAAVADAYEADAKDARLRAVRERIAAEKAAAAASAAPKKKR